MSERPSRPRGRAAPSNASSRFEAWQRQPFDDGWGPVGAAELSTRLLVDSARSVINFNRSPDVPFDRSANPYRGCEHGCIYCYARPSHTWLGHSAGLDFESVLYYKPDAAACLRRELARPGYRCAPLALGVNTDAYQPSERRIGLTRALLEELAGYRHPVVLITKSALIERDLDILAPMAAEGLVQVHISLTTLRPELARVMEPRAATPARRLATMRRLVEAGVPCGVMVAPLVPVLSDGELEAILEAAREAGAGFAEYALLRLPREVEELFGQWLAEYFPAMRERVLGRLADCHGGRVYDSRYGKRMFGSGGYAQLIAQRFALASRRPGYSDVPGLNCDRFGVPPTSGGQMTLF